MPEYIDNIIGENEFFERLEKGRADYVILEQLREEIDFCKDKGINVEYHATVNGKSAIMWYIPNGNKNQSTGVLISTDYQ